MLLEIFKSRQEALRTEIVSTGSRWTQQQCGSDPRSLRCPAIWWHQLLSWKHSSFNLLGYSRFRLWLCFCIEILDHNLSSYWQENSNLWSIAWIIEHYWQGDFCGWPLKAFSFPVSSVPWLFIFKAWDNILLPSFELNQVLNFIWINDLYSCLKET